MRKRNINICVSFFNSSLSNDLIILFFFEETKMNYITTNKGLPGTRNAKEETSKKQRKNTVITRLSLHQRNTQKQLQKLAYT